MIAHGVPAWVEGYIGLPFAERGYDRHGINCWGLYRLVALEQFGVALPTHADRYTDLKLDRRAIAETYLAHVTDWYTVAEKRGEDLFHRIDPAVGDGVLMSVDGRPLHCGMVVKRGVMLHIERGIDSMLEYYDRGAWKHRVMGLYRFARPA